MVGTLRLAVVDTDNTKDEQNFLGSCTQSSVSGSCKEYICPANMTSLMSLEDQPYQGRVNTNLSSTDYFQPWSLDAFLVRSVESVLFAPDRESIYDAAEAGDVTAVDAFLDAGVQIDARRDVDGLTPLLVAARFGQQEVCETLLRRGADVAATTSSLSSPLHLAAGNGKAICCQLFLAAGGDPNSEDADGQTPLHLAALGGHTATVRLLLAAGANHSVTTSIDDTPLHLAVDRGHDAVCRILVQHGATPSVRDRNSSTPLHMCAEKGTGRLARLLLEKGALPNARDDCRKTPVMIASEFGNIEVLVSIFQAVKCMKHESVNRLVEQVNDLQGTALHFACMTGKLHVMDLLLREGASLNRKGGTGMLPLHFAARGNHRRAVEFLLGRGADFECKDSMKRSVLHMAAMNQNEETLRYLLDQPCCTVELVNAQSTYGITPSHYAARMKCQKNLEVLVCHGADLSIKDADDMSPIDVFCFAEDLFRCPPQWSMTTHSNFPFRFKVAVRALLFAAAADSMSTKTCGLGLLPEEVIFRIIGNMLHPPKKWMIGPF